MAGDTTRCSIGILGDFIDRPVEGGIIHFFMGMIRAKMATSTGIRISRLLQRKFMGVMATVTSFLNAMTSLTKSCPDFLRDGEIFSLYSHSLKPDGMAAPFELLQFLFVALPTFIRENHRLLFRGRLVIDMTGHAMNALFCMFRFDPGLKKPGGHLLMTVHTESRVHVRNDDLWPKK
jgi:hypothetical protein